jgi:uncharacterized membrane protein YhiD involved in acid resistance
MDGILNFTDVVKKSITKLEAFSKISSFDVFFNLLVALAVALFIFYIYKTTFKGVVYNYGFNLSLLLMCILTSIVIMTISTNVVLSLGMVGALSIVRFRTALKDPLDIVFMFWAIVAGITTGAGTYPIAIIGSLFVGIILLVFTKFKMKDPVYIFVVHYEEEANDKVKVIMNKLHYSLKSKTVSNRNIELTVEVRIKGDNTAFVNEISSIAGVKDAVLVGYNGEYAA